MILVGDIMAGMDITCRQKMKTRGDLVGHPGSGFRTTPLALCGYQPVFDHDLASVVQHHPVLGVMLFHQRSQDEDGGKRGRDVHCSHHVKDGCPGARRFHDQVADRNQQGGHALGAVEHAIDLADMLGAEGIAGRGAEQAVHLTPGQEHDARQDHERPWVVPEGAKREDAKALDREGDEHRLFAADHGPRSSRTAVERCRS
mgnify:CR=1 FL=1